ncbi:uncharacterized protein J5F26_009492 isoform 2-T17 [Ciconia maguari]
MGSYVVTTDLSKGNKQIQDSKVVNDKRRFLHSGPALPAVSFQSDTRMPDSFKTVYEKEDNCSAAYWAHPLSRDTAQLETWRNIACWDAVRLTSVVHFDSRFLFGAVEALSDGGRCRSVAHSSSSSYGYREAWVLIWLLRSTAGLCCIPSTGLVQ